jgi:hypothetical protein
MVPDVTQLARLDEIKTQIAESEVEFQNPALLKITRQCIATRLAGLRREARETADKFGMDPATYLGQQ